MKKSYLTMAALIGMAVTATAQKTNSEVFYKNGQTFQKTTTVQSTSKLTGTKTTVNITSSSTINTTYVVKDSSAAGYTFDFTINAMTTDIESGGKKTSYNSNGPTDTTSLLTKALNQVVGKKMQLKTNRSGIITNTGNASNITPVVQNNIAKFTNGKVFDLNAAMPVNNATRPGDTWTDSTTFNGGSQVIHYTVKTVTNGMATITFAGVIAGTTEVTNNDVTSKQEFTMNTDGEFLVNTSTGIIQNRTSNCNTTGKIITDNNTVLTAVNSTTREVVTNL